MRIHVKYSSPVWDNKMLVFPIEEPEYAEMTKFAQYLDEYGVDLEDLSDQLNYSLGYLRNIAEGFMSMPMEVALDISDALNCELDDIMDEMH